MSYRHPGRYVRRIPHVEPPADDPCASLRRHAVRRATPHDGRSGRTAPARQGGPRVQVESTVPVDRFADPVASRFAESAIRLVLEAVDGRRPTAQLTAVLDPRLIDSVAATRAARAGQGTATLMRSRLRPVDAATVELFGSYSRGDRVFAFAGRMARASSRARRPGAWTITTLWLG